MNHPRRRPLFWALPIIMMSAVVPTLFAQVQDQVQDEEQQERIPMGQASPEMREMARAMKSMADMCQMMMQREMAMKPLMMGATITLGSLLAIALVLFIVLEVQWIRFWSLHIKSERRKLA